MSFARPELLWLLLLLPAAVAWLRAGRSGERRDLDRFGPGVPVADGSRRRVLRVLAPLLLLVVAAAGPRVGERLEERPGRALDVVVLLDASRSMAVADVAPDRLGRARRELLAFADAYTGGRLALVTFGGGGRLLCPLTRDRAAFAGFVREVDPVLTMHGGTDLAAGLRAALEAFPRESDARQAIVLLSDGENLQNDADVDRVAWAAYAAGVTVHAILLGAPGGGPIPVRDRPGGGYLTDAAGTPIRSVPDPTLLQAAARRTGGMFAVAVDEPFPLERVRRERLADVEITAAGTVRSLVPVERYRWFVAAALVLLLVPVPARTRPARGTAFAAAAVLFGFAGVPDAAREGNAHFLAGDYEAACERFETARDEQPGSAAVEFNLGTTLHRLGRHDEAAAAFGRARAAAGDPALCAKSAFGAGVTRARRAEAVAEDERGRRTAIQLLRGARRDLVAALALGYGRDAALDLELVTERLRELERGPPPDEAGRPRGGTPAGEPDDESPRAGEDAAVAGEEAPPRPDAPAVDGPPGADPEPGDVPARLPGGMFREEARNLEEIVERYQRERAELDRQRARARRSRVERDW